MDRRETLYARLLRLVGENRARERSRKRRAARITASVRARRASGPGRRPPEAGIAVPAVPPKGPLPKQGGAEAPLTFD